MWGRKLERSRTPEVFDSLDLVNLPQPSVPLAEGQIDTNRFQIKDHTAMGGMSDLERERKLIGDVFMPPDIRALYEREANSGGSRTVGMETSASLEQNHSSGQQGADLFLQIKTASRDTMHNLTTSAPPVPHLSEQHGSLIMLPGHGSGMDQAGQNQGSFKTQSMPAPNAPAAFQAVEQRPVMSATAAMGQQPATALGDQISANFKPSETAKSDTGPLQSVIPSPWQHKTPSPFVELFSRFLKLVLMLLGINGQSGYRGGRPEQGHQ